MKFQSCAFFLSLFYIISIFKGATTSSEPFDLDPMYVLKGNLTKQVHFTDFEPNKLKGI